MNIECPYCTAILTPKGMKPGNYTPKCPKCANTFALKVPRDGQALTVEQIIPKPLPKTKPVPILKRSDLPMDDEEDDENSEEHGGSDNIADVDEHGKKPLPKTQRYPTVRKPKPPEPDNENDG